MNNDPRTWEIWLAEVKFEDNPKTKKRPILIMDKHRGFIIGYKITSHEPRLIDGEYSIRNWKECGLNKKSTIRFTHKIELERAKCIHKIGLLSLIDIINVRTILKNLY